LKQFMSDPIKIVYKSNEAAFLIACKYHECEILIGMALPALVIDARNISNALDAVKKGEDGIQTAVLKVASEDGGFKVLAQTIGPNGPNLLPGDFVAWEPYSYLEKLGKDAEDSRTGWVGLIIGTLTNTYENGSWVGDQRFS